MSCVAVLLVGCSESKPQRWEMLEAAMLPQWQAVAIEGAGKPQMGPGEFGLPGGAPVTAGGVGGAVRRMGVDGAAGGGLRDRV